MASALVKFSAICMLIGLTAADVGIATDTPVTEVCLGCLCQAVSGCQVGQQCDGDACGLFRITWAYWADAGKPTLAGSSPEAPDAYPSCTNDPYCAARTVQQYMRRFGQDCNGDGRIDCLDFAAIHKLGGYGCKADLPFKFYNTLTQCLDYVSQIQDTEQFLVLVALLTIHTTGLPHRSKVLQFCGKKLKRALELVCSETERNVAEELDMLKKYSKKGRISRERFRTHPRPSQRWPPPRYLIGEPPVLDPGDESSDLMSKKGWYVPKKSQRLKRDYDVNLVETCCQQPCTLHKMRDFC
ncbi:unnamed protein product, partial [Iphiclides podalirius]